MNDDFRYAQLLAITAMSLDYDKNTFPGEAKEIARECVEQLHLLAITLAGDQVDKLYASQ